MEKLYVWSIARSGAGLTISHSTGHLTGFARAYYCTDRHKMIAVHKDGREFELRGDRPYTQRFAGGQPVGEPQPV